MISIRQATEFDLVEINEIYNEAVVDSTASFDLEPQPIELRQEWFNQHDDRFVVMVAEMDEQVEAWASLTRWSPRRGYDATAESSVYVRRQSWRRGIGRQLQTALINHARQHDFHTLMALTTSENQGSLRMHEEFGFRVVGTMGEAGYKFDRWLDVCIMQLMLTDETTTISRE